MSRASLSGGADSPDGGSVALLEDSREMAPVGGESNGKDTPSPSPKSPPGGDQTPSSKSRYIPPQVLEFFSPSKEKERPRQTEKMEAQFIDISDKKTSVRFSESPRAGRSSEQGMLQEVKQFVVSVNFMSQYVTKPAKVFCILVIISALLALASGISVLVIEFSDERKVTISDNSACEGLQFVDIKTNSVGYNVANIILTSLYIVWISARAVRLEKEGLLFGFVFVAVSHSARLIYFSFFVAHEHIGNQKLLLSLQICNTVSSVLAVVSVFLTPLVSRGFGWRMYTKGVTQVSDVEQMRRYKQFDALVKMDIFICIVSFTSIFFLVSNNAARYLGGALAALTLFSLFTITRFVKKHAALPVYFFFVFMAVMPVYYAYTVGTLVMMNEGHCHTDVLRPCISARNITIFSGNESVAEQLAHTAGYYDERAVVATAAAGHWWILWNCTTPDNTVPANFSNATLDCVSQAEGTITSCCDTYGRCERKQIFRNHDRWMMIFTAAVGLVIRIGTVLLGLRQLRDMNMPSVRQLFRRGEHNIRSFGLYSVLFDEKNTKSSTEPTLIDPGEHK